jgi:hypothetical protein
VQEFDALDVAAAAIHLVHEATEKGLPEQAIPAQAAQERGPVGRPRTFGPPPPGPRRGPAGRPRPRH